VVRAETQSHRRPGHIDDLPALDVPVHPGAPWKASSCQGSRVVHDREALEPRVRAMSEQPQQRTYGAGLDDRGAGTRARRALGRRRVPSYRGSGATLTVRRSSLCARLPRTRRLKRSRGWNTRIRFAVTSTSPGLRDQRS
jgi:hypothetical protein